MKRNLTLLILAGAFPLAASALEVATTGSQATQATVGVINSKVDTTNAIINNILACNNVRKFYAPSDPKKDANGCVGIQDYSLTMNDTNGIATSNGMLLGQSAANWAIKGIGSSSGYGIYGQSPNQALNATNTGTTNWTAVINGGSSPYGLDIYNASNNAQLCLNSSCTTSLASTDHFGGIYSCRTTGGVCSCTQGNFQTSACSCPPGFTGFAIVTSCGTGCNDYNVFCQK